MQRTTQMAVGAIKAVRSEGRTIPDEFAVTGIDNLSVSSMIEPSLTTVNVPTYQMGRMAVKMLADPDIKERSSRTALQFDRSKIHE